MKITLWIIIIFMFLGTAFWLTANCNTTSEERNMNYGISLSTDNTSYCDGEYIKIALKIFNYTDEQISFQFNSSQRYDFIIADEEENEIWRWSKDRMFAMLLGEETLGLNNNNTTVVYTERVNTKLAPGYYKITGIFVSNNRPMSGSIMIEIR